MSGGQIPFVSFSETDAQEHNQIVTEIIFMASLLNMNYNNNSASL